jgi:hypothetical protein
MRSGTVAGEVVFKTYYDKTVISRKLDSSNRVVPKKQVEMNKRMKQANAYCTAFLLFRRGKITSTDQVEITCPPIIVSCIA